MPNHISGCNCDSSKNELFGVLGGVPVSPLVCSSSSSKGLYSSSSNSRLNSSNISSTNTNSICNSSINTYSRRINISSNGRNNVGGGERGMPVFGVSLVGREGQR